MTGSSNGSPNESKGVAFTNWLVSKAAGVLDRKSSRRGFIMGSAMVGSAVAVAGCAPGTQPGTPYNHITDCAGGLCADGYTEFCCTINNGLNVCPPGTFVAGWWRADYSTFCNGTRYYMDCNESCCGPDLGNGFCAGCHEARCAGGCDTRRVYANYFRYGQCHQEIGILGPIACRLVTCVPPYTVGEYACTTAAAVDNSTAEHAPAHGCTPPLPPLATVLPALGAAAVTGSGSVTGFTRFPDSFIYANTFSGGNWSGWFKGSPAINSGIASATDATGTYVIARAVDNQVRYNRLVNGAWAGEGVLGGISPVSNPVAVSSPTGIYVAVRMADKSVAWGRFLNGTWSGWAPLGGYVNSNPTMVATQWGVFLFARGGDNALYVNRCQGTSWSGWTSLGGTVSSDPTCAVDSSGVYVFARSTDNAVWGRKWSGGSWSGWFSLGGTITSDPVATKGAGGDGILVFARGLNNDAWVNRLSGSWTGFRPMGGTIDTDMTVVAASSSVFVFARGLGAGVWAGQYANGNWNGWYPLGGSSSPLNALS